MNVCCPHYHQPIATVRCGVRLPVLKVAIFDRIKRAGDFGVTSAEILSDVYFDRRPVSITTIKAHVRNHRDGSRVERKLASDGRDLHDVVDIIEGGGGLIEAAMRKLYDAGYEAGLAQGESRHPVTMHNVDPDGWYEIAQYCWERVDRLPQRHRNFIEHMIELAGEVELSIKKQSYLKSLYRQLGGR